MGLLGSLLLACDDVQEILQLVTEESFYDRRHQLVFHAIQTLVDQHGAVDTILLSELLEREGQSEKAGGLAYILELADSVRTSINAVEYARIIRDRSLMRRLISTCTELVQGASNGVVEDASQFLEYAEQRIFEIAEKKSGHDVVSLRDAIKGTFDLIDEWAKGRSGLPSGFTDLDRMTTGLHPSELVVVAGRPSMGKTTFTMNLARHVAVEHKKPVLVFSLEVDRRQLAMNMLCAAAKVNSQALRSVSLGNREWQRR